MKKITLFLISWVVVFSVFSQNQVDALRYSQMIYGGTARSLGIGNAFGALGADFSVLSTNPAGIGFYKGSEFTFSPSLYVGKSSALYSGNENEDIRYNFNVSNAGIVFAIIPKRAESSWKGVQFGFGVNRLANYNNSVMIEGANAKNSILDDYWAEAEGTKPSELDPFDTELAFNTYLLDTMGGLTQYFTAIPRGGTTQSKYIEQRGSVNEMVLTLGGNYNDRFYIGGTFGFPYLRFNESSTYRETDDADTISGFKEMTLYDDLETSGTGFNFKLGMIYRITDWVRIGASFHTPTFYDMKDLYYKEMTSVFDNADDYEARSPEGAFSYKLTTPLRITGSLAFVIGQRALISADYEFVDYSDARLRSKSYKFFDENKAIDGIYTATSNVRVGAEVKFAPVSIRGGFQWNSSPYKNNINDGQRIAISGGIGIRDKSYFVDLGYVYSKKSEDYYLYPSVPSAAENAYTNHNIVLTLGYKF